MGGPRADQVSFFGEDVEFEATNLQAAVVEGYNKAVQSGAASASLAVLHKTKKLRGSVAVRPQLVDGASGGVAAAAIIGFISGTAFSGTLVISDGVDTETYTAVNAGTEDDVQPDFSYFVVSGDAAATMQNIVDCVNRSSTRFGAVVAPQLDGLFTDLGKTTPAGRVMVIYFKNPATSGLSWKFRKGAGGDAFPGTVLTFRVNGSDPNAYPREVGDFDDGASQVPAATFGSQPQFSYNQPLSTAGFSGPVYDGDVFFVVALGKVLRWDKNASAFVDDETRFREAIVHEEQLYLQNSEAPLNPAILVGVDEGGQPATDDTVVLTRETGTAETFTFKASRGAAFEVTIGADERETLRNFAEAINMDSSYWEAEWAGLGDLSPFFGDVGYAPNVGATMLIKRRTSHAVQDRLHGLFLELGVVDFSDALDYSTGVLVEYGQRRTRGFRARRLPRQDTERRMFGPGRLGSAAQSQHEEHLVVSDGVRWDTNRSQVSRIGPAAAGSVREVVVSASQLAAAGLRGAVIVGGTDNPTNNQTFVISNGSTTETYTFKDTPAGGNDVQIGGDLDATLTNLRNVIVANSAVWAGSGALPAGLDGIGYPEGSRFVLHQVTPSTVTTDRCYGTATTLLVGTFSTLRDYAPENCRTLPLSPLDSRRRQFGLARLIASVRQGEIHQCVVGTGFPSGSLVDTFSDLRMWSDGDWKQLNDAANVGIIATFMPENPVTVTAAVQAIHERRSPQLLATDSGIDGKVVAEHVLYTVPAARQLLHCEVEVFVEAADTVSVPPEAGAGTDASEDNIVASAALTGLTAVGLSTVLPAKAAHHIPVEGEQVKLGIDVGATATTLTLGARVWGVLIDYVAPE